MCMSFKEATTLLLYVSVCESAAAAKYATVCPIKVTAQPLAGSFFISRRQRRRRTGSGGALAAENADHKEAGKNSRA